MKALFDFVWEKVPWWIKGYFVLVMGPNIVLIIGVFFLALEPWVIKKTHAIIRPYKEVRDIEIKHMNGKLDSMDRKLDILILRTR